MGYDHADALVAAYQREGARDGPVTVAGVEVRVADARVEDVD